MSTVNLFGTTELAQAQSTIGTTYLGETRTELLKQILVAIANRNGGTGGGAITGEGKLWFTGTAPNGWLLCNGAAVSRTTYADLFAVIGTTFGTGDGSTTFNIPDFRGRVPAGVDEGTFTSLGTTLGEENVTLTEAQVPPLDDTFTDAIVGGVPVVSSVQYESVANEGHNNIQPTLVVNFIIKT
jgi:microcystin-dependent protein